MLTTCHNLTCVEGAWETTNACNKLCASVSTRITSCHLLPSNIINVRHFKATVKSLHFLYCSNDPNIVFLKDETKVIHTDGSCCSCEQISKIPFSLSIQMHLLLKSLISCLSWVNYQDWKFFFRSNTNNIHHNISTNNKEHNGHTR